jgi:pimeloyl-ACP methyl ester carboxylesterase
MRSALLVAWWPCVGLGAQAQGTRTQVAVTPSERLAVFVHAPAMDTGAARIVLIPPVMGSAFSLRHVTAQLAAHGHAVAVIDPLGMGESTAPLDADYTFAAQAQRVLAALDSLGWAEVIVGGQATSATIAFHMAARAPERVRAVVAISGGAVTAQQTDGVVLAVRFASVVNSPPGRAFARNTVERQLRGRSLHDAWLTPSVLQAYLAPWESDLAGRLRAVGVMSETDEPMPIETVLARVRCPVTVLLGEGPARGLPTAVEVDRVRRSIPHAQVIPVSGAGAMLPEEAPAAVADALVQMARRLRAR